MFRWNYSAFTNHKGTTENICKTISNHFAAIAEAECALWKAVDSDKIIGSLQTTRSTNNRTEEEANVMDILSLVAKLDKGEKNANHINALDLGSYTMTAVTPRRVRYHWWID